MWLSLASWWSNSKIAQGITAVFLLLIGWSVVKRNIKEAAKKAERQANATRAAQAETRIVTTIQENSDALVRETERVRSADAIVELPDGTKGLPDYHFRD